MTPTPLDPERAAELDALRAAGCTCPELHAGLQRTGVLSRSALCKLHGAGTADWRSYVQRANERTRGLYRLRDEAIRARAERLDSRPELDDSDATD